jgi:hypothetical protein
MGDSTGELPQQGQVFGFFKFGFQPPQLLRGARSGLDSPDPVCNDVLLLGKVAA